MQSQDYHYHVGGEKWPSQNFIRISPSKRESPFLLSSSKVKIMAFLVVTRSTGVKGNHFESSNQEIQKIDNSAPKEQNHTVLSTICNHRFFY